jgi:hypothetical protein
MAPGSRRRALFRSVALYGITQADIALLLQVLYILVCGIFPGDGMYKPPVLLPQL